MSRSYKKHPSCGYICYFSNKKDKQKANRKLRKINKQIIKSLSNGRTYIEDTDEFNPNIPLYNHDWWEYPSVCQLDEADYFKTLREISDVWDFSSDGLPGTISEYQYIWDNSVLYEGSYVFHPKTTIAEARRNHNWKTLKYFISK